MYVDREPRFYASVHYNGRPVLSAITVDDRNYFSSDKNKDGFGRAEYYYSGSSGAGTQMTDFTGYNVAKKVSTSSSIRNDQAVYRPYIHIRYAEILLNYMEAMNEYNPEDPKIITYFNEIRERAGIPNITVTYPQDLGDKEKCVNGFFANVRLNWHLKATVSGRLRAGYFMRKKRIARFIV